MKWSDLSIQEKADLMKLYVANGITNLDTMKQHYNSFQEGGSIKTNNTEEPNFITRLKQGYSRKSIIDNQGNPASHKLGVADSRVYPEVQEDEKGNLRDYGTIPYREFYAYDRALKNNDYIEFPDDESAVNFTRYYKDSAIYPWYGTFDNYVPWRYFKGGHLKQKGGLMNIPYPLNETTYPYPQTRVPFSDVDNKTWLNWWYNGRGRQLEQNYSNGILKYIDTAVETPLIFDKQPKDRPTLGGAYSYKNRNITLYPYSKKMDNEGRNVLLHEQVHALNYAPLQANDLHTYSPDSHIARLHLQEKLGGDFDHYWDSSDEIYSRLMEFRKQNKLHPSKYQDKEQIKKWRDSGKLKQFMLDRYDDDTLLYLFNEVADNSSDNTLLNVAAKGGSLGHITPYGQWQYPGEVTTIPSNNITMKGVDYPVVGISDTGDTKYMLPNMDYLFDGDYVTEYPLN